MTAGLSSTHRRRSLAYRGDTPLGTSLVCIALRVCNLNHISTDDLLTGFTNGRNRSDSRFDWAEPGPIDGERLMQSLGLPVAVIDGYAPASYRNVSDPPDWVEENYRFCPACETSAAHLSMFQLKSLRTCPVHRLDLRTACERCGIRARAYVPKTSSTVRCASCRARVARTAGTSAAGELHAVLKGLQACSLLTQHGHLPVGLDRKWHDDVLRAFLALKAIVLGRPFTSMHIGNASAFLPVPITIEFRRETSRFDLTHLYRAIRVAIERTVPSLADWGLHDLGERIARTAAGGKGEALLSVEEAAYLGWRRYWEARNHVWQTLDGPERIRIPHLMYVSIEQELQSEFFVSQALLLVSSYVEAVHVRHEDSMCASNVLSPWEPSQSRDFWAITISPEGVHASGWIPKAIARAYPSVAASIEACRKSLGAWRTDNSDAYGDPFRWSCMRA